jgi:hypothetical protein
MAFRTNYRFERVERDRVKKAKKEEKVRKRQERGAVPAPESSEHTDDQAPSEE